MPRTASTGTAQQAAQAVATGLQGRRQVGPDGLEVPDTGLGLHELRVTAQVDTGGRSVLFDPARGRGEQSAELGQARRAFDGPKRAAPRNPEFLCTPDQRILPHTHHAEPVPAYGLQVLDARKSRREHRRGIRRPGRRRRFTASTARLSSDSRRVRPARSAARLSRDRPVRAGRRRSCGDTSRPGVRSGVPHQRRRACRRVRAIPSVRGVAPVHFLTRPVRNFLSAVGKDVEAARRVPVPTRGKPFRRRFNSGGRRSPGPRTEPLRGSAPPRPRHAPGGFGTPTLDRAGPRPGGARSSSVPAEVPASTPASGRFGEVPERRGSTFVGATAVYSPTSGPTGWSATIWTAARPDRPGRAG